MAKACEESGVDGLLVGGSLLLSEHFDDFVASLKKTVSIPVILFPGNGHQLSRHADALFFLSLLSGRNPHYLIGEQVHSAPRIRALGLEAISTAYLLVESGRTTSAQFMSDTRPLPSNKPDIAVAHALAAAYLGFRFIYLEAGSGAEHPVPDAMVQAVGGAVDLPVIVGGGIRTPEEAEKKVRAGASFIVAGTVFEGKGKHSLLRGFVDAVHR